MTRRRLAILVTTLGAAVAVVASLRAWRSKHALPPPPANDAGAPVVTLRLRSLAS
jgi:hypothetical protein